MYWKIYHLSLYYMDACAKFLLQFKVLFNLLHQLENNNQGGLCYSTIRITSIIRRQFYKIFLLIITHIKTNFRWLTIKPREYFGMKWKKKTSYVKDGCMSYHSQIQFLDFHCWITTLILPVPNIFCLYLKIHPISSLIIINIYFLCFKILFN